MKMFRIVILSLAVGLTVTGGALATSLTHMHVDDMSRAADTVIVGTVESQETVRDGNAINTLITFTVEDAITGQPGQAPDERIDLGCWYGALEPIDRLPLPESIDGWNRLNAKLRSNRLVLVDIDLDHTDLAAGLGHRGFQHGAERLARPAPGRPEIDDDRDLAAGLDHVGHEGGLGAVLDQVARGGGLRLRVEFQHGANSFAC